MIGLAAQAGADAVKFQTIVPDRLVPASQTDRLAQLRKLRLSYTEFEKLAAVARQAGLQFLSTPFDVESVDFLAPLVPAFKVASGDNQFYPLIERIARTAKPMMISTGLATDAELLATRDRVYTVWDQMDVRPQLALLHCVAAYPTPSPEANLGAIRRLENLGCVVGYSDHTLGIEAPVLAVALGARIIEKHFTIDKQYSDFRDHQLSADPQEFGDMVTRIKQAQTLLGRGDTEVSESEQAGVQAFRRSIVAAVDLPRGVTVERDRITWLRPGGGLPPGQEDLVVGKVIKQGLRAGEMILPDNLE